MEPLERSDRESASDRRGQARIPFSRQIRSNRTSRRVYSPNLAADPLRGGSGAPGPARRDGVGSRATYLDPPETSARLCPGALLADREASAWNIRRTNLKGGGYGHASALPGAALGRLPGPAAE